MHLGQIWINNQEKQRKIENVLPVIKILLLHNNIYKLFLAVNADTQLCIDIPGRLISFVQNSGSDVEQSAVDLLRILADCAFGQSAGIEPHEPIVPIILPETFYRKKKIG